MKTKTPNAMKTTATEIKATNALKLSAGSHIRAVLTIDERAALGIDVDGATFDLCVSTLRELAQSRIEAKRAVAAARSPLISDRYVDALARGLSRLFNGDAAPNHWASITKAVLHTSYMTGAVPLMAQHAAHPGSRAGVIVVDLRTPSLFADRHGDITPKSIRARVAGQAAP